MSRAVSAVSGKPYGLAAVCRVWPDPGFIATSLRHPTRRQDGAGQSGRCPLQR